MQERICILALVSNLVLNFIKLLLKLRAPLLSIQELFFSVALCPFQSFNFLFMVPNLRVVFLDFALHFLELTFSEAVFISVGLEFASDITELFLLESHLLIKLSL